MFQVKDGDRVLQFEGKQLAHSSSYRADADRWVEFDLYRTEAGAYVVARVGYSNLFHTADCKVVRRGRHSPAPVATLTEDSKACELCSPVTSVDQAHELIYPEKPIYWAQVCQNADGALESLAMYDQDGARYFTHVARKLIRDAAKHDMPIRDAYYVEVIA
jgi:hypothetical protein